MHIQSLNGEWQFRLLDNGSWMPAQVPGGVHTDLLNVGMIPDPFVADNELRVQWVAESDWEYRRTFTVPTELMAEQRVLLVCDGLDTLAEVMLNGQLVGKGENMFRQYRWDVKPLLHEGENELTVLFRSPVQYIEARQSQRALRGVAQAIPGGPYLRKAPCQFGWDWGPQLPPIGIWKDIRLEGRSVARLTDVHVRQRHDDAGVSIAVRARIARWQDVPLKVMVRATAPDGKVQQAQAAVVGESQTVMLGVEDPQLWWPNGYGDQPLYAVEVVLVAEGDGGTCDARRYQVGLRTLELRREPDEWGESFTFVVNGVPIFAKGSNWIPADSFPTRIGDALMEQLIRDAAATHQNMLRVWGGGFYEEERFYDLCDRYGLLVWQDFTYACSVYPMDDDAFVENARVEAVENLRRLRHRASLALWCGNNEMEAGWVHWGWGHNPAWEDLKAAYDRFFHHLLPRWVAEEDPDTAYWPSSPSSGIPFENPQSEERGDAHYWGVWHGGQPFSAYRQQHPRFMSEFGFQALPPLATVRTYAEEQDWNMTSYIMEHHQRSGSGNGKIVGHMTDHFRMPKDFPALVYLSMVLQAEGIRFGVEHWRRNMARVSGTLYWQLNDCWPVASWSSLDYYGRWKALHYAARHFYAPVLLSIEDRGAKMGVHVTSDLTEAWEGTVRWSLETLAGEKLESGEEAVEAAPLASTLVCALDFGESVDREARREVVFIAELWQGAEPVARSLATLVPNKHLELVDPGLAAELSEEAHTLHVTLKAKSLARFVELALEGADAVFSDNYVDVPAGRAVTVSCPMPEGWSLAEAREKLRLRSLYDSFA